MECIKCRQPKKIYCKLMCRTCYNKDWEGRNPERLAKIKKLRAICQKRWWKEHPKKNKEYKEKYKKKIKKYQARHYQEIKDTEGYKRKRKVISANYYQRNKEKVYARKRAKTLKKQPCIICMKYPTESHHQDYSKPLEVIWLCKKHHWQLHYGTNQAKKEIRERAKERGIETK